MLHSFTLFLHMKYEVMEYNLDYVLVECNMEALKTFVESLEPQYDIRILKHPSKCMTMIGAADSVENQPFYLGEALTMECEVSIYDKIGYGICLGDQPVRCYCIAVIDALREIADQNWQQVLHFVNEQGRLIETKEREEFHQILKTRVDFKLMEEA